MNEPRVEREIVLPAEPDDIWRELSEPERLSEWLGGEVEAELRPGGELSVSFDDGERREGFVEEVDEPRRLVFWWSADEDDEASRVEIELEEVEDGTLVRVVEALPISTLLATPAFAPGQSGGAPGAPQLSAVG